MEVLLVDNSTLTHDVPSHNIEVGVCCGAVAYWVCVCVCVFNPPPPEWKMFSVPSPTS